MFSPLNVYFNSLWRTFLKSDGWSPHDNSIRVGVLLFTDASCMFPSFSVALACGGMYSAKNSLLTGQVSQSALRALETPGPESIIYPLWSCSCLLFRNYLVGCNLKCCRVFHGVRRKHSEIPDYITHTKRCSGYLKWPSLSGLCSPAVTATWKCKRTRHTPTQPLKCVTVRQLKEDTRELTYGPV